MFEKDRTVVPDGVEGRGREGEARDEAGELLVGVCPGAEHIGEEERHLQHPRSYRVIHPSAHIFLYWPKMGSCNGVYSQKRLTITNNHRRDKLMKIKISPRRSS